MKILILGGTGEARALATRLVAMGHDVTTSLAGRTREPALPPGAIRRGGFGGAAGLEAYLRTEAITRLVDATHPYAAQISTNAVTAAQNANVPLLRLTRPEWPEPAGANWIITATMAEAAAALPAGAMALITTGHGDLETLLTRTDCRLLVRLIEAPTTPVPPHARLLLSRPPYDLETELALMRSENITHLVSKNSGGSQTVAKLEAARQLGVQVIMIARPNLPPAREVATIDEAIAALDLS